MKSGNATHLVFPGCAQTNTPKVPAAPIVKERYLEQTIALWATAAQRLAGLDYKPKHNGTPAAAQLAEAIGNCGIPLAAWVHKRLCDYSRAPFTGNPYPPYNFVWSTSAFAAALDDISWAFALDQTRVRISKEEQQLQQRYMIVSVSGKGADEYMKTLQEIRERNVQIQADIDRAVKLGCYVW